jgi:hypothetical protein
MPKVDLICLANSYKYGGRCVAGLRTDGGGWVRPVTAAPHGAFGRDDLGQVAAFDPRLLDLIRVRLEGPRPVASQPENWLVDGRRWRLVERPAARAGAGVLEAALCRGPALLGDTGRAIAEASFRRAPAEESLAIVEPSAIVWRRSFDERAMRLKDRAVFDLAGVCYDLPLTDPVYLERLKPLREGEHENEEVGIPRQARVLLTISLSEPYEGLCYKLAAAVVVLPPTWQWQPVGARSR